jgi:hypothetical protein
MCELERIIAGYDSEPNQSLAWRERNVRSIIPAKHGLVPSPPACSNVVSKASSTHAPPRANAAKFD